MYYNYLIKGDLENFVKNLLSDDSNADKESGMYRLAWIMEHIKNYSPAFKDINNPKNDTVEEVKTNSDEVPSWF